MPFPVSLPVVPRRPVLDLITGRVDAAENSVTAHDIYNCQIRWDFAKIYRLDLDRRAELCKELLKLMHKLAPELHDSDAGKLWKQVAQAPSWPDQAMSRADDETENEEPE